MSRVVTIPYRPRPLQRQLHAERVRKRFLCLVCHRRFGKTVFAINELVKGALTCKLERPRFAYFAPLLKQAKAIAWDYLLHYTAPIPGRAVNLAELRVDLPNGARVQLFGMDNPDAARGLYFDGAVLDEFGQMPERGWNEVILPALSDRAGWAIVLGTPQGRNQFYRLYNHARRDDAWHAALFKASETDLFDAADLTQIRANMSQDAYEQEYECSFAVGARGAYYAHYIEKARDDKRVTKVPYEPNLEVHTAWDLGVSRGADSMAIWFYQINGRAVQVIDYYGNEGEGLPHYAKVLDERGYKYGRHWAPHDIAAKEIGTGKTRIETAATLGIEFDIAPNVSVLDGIEAVRSVLNRCWFDEVKCKYGLDALEAYRREENPRTGELKDVPLHDWSSHPADAFRMLALTVDENKPSWGDEPVQFDAGYIV